jgi:YggT family protein
MLVVVADFLDALAVVIDKVLWLYSIVILARVLVSWVNADRFNPIVQLLYKLTEPVLYPIRRMLGRSNLGIDISPIIVILLIIFLQAFLVRALAHTAMQLR